MSSLANWSYTAVATYWQMTSKDEYNKPIFAAPVVINCDYGGDLSKRDLSIGNEIVVKDTVWTEFATAKKGDYLMIGESSELDPIAAGADEIVHVIRYADTFERLADDYAIMTG